MSAQLIDGKAHAAAVKEALKPRIAKLQQQQCTPGLVVILVGEDPASTVYVRNKVKACEAIGIHSVLETHPQSFTQEALLERIHSLNVDPSVHGILVQLPLPPHIDPHTVIAAIAQHKDVDAFDVSNVGALMVGRPQFQPCTPSGVMRLLERENIALRGAEAVVIGASNIVGKPLAIMLLHAGATVTICNSKTKDLAAHTRRADILVVAVGRANLITGAMIKPGATLIDVGINRKADGSLCGDVDFPSCVSVAGAITPVPGGVGPMTIAMLLENTVIAAEQTIGAR